MNRTPLETAIAETTDRRVRHVAKLRRAGLVKVTVWVTPDEAARIKREASDQRKALGL